MSNSNEELSNKLVAQGAALKPSSIIGQMKPWFEARVENVSKLCGSEEKARKLYVTSMTYITNRPDLMKCDARSLQQCIMQSAVLGLYPGVLSQCDYIVFKDQAKFVVGFQGLIKLATQSGLIEDIGANVVYSADKFEYEEGTNSFVSLKKYIGPRNQRGERICCYAEAKFKTGRTKFVIMTPEEVMSIKNRSKAKNSEYSPWNTDVDSEDEMWKKTVIKRLSKLLPKSTEEIKFATAIALDNAAENPDDKDSSLSLPVYDDGEFEE